jgi:hypothetical protein
MRRIDGRYACSKSMRAVHEIIPPGSQKETLMVASGFFVFNVAPIHWFEQIKTKNTGLRSKARVSMLGLNQFFGKRVSVIPRFM